MNYSLMELVNDFTDSAPPLPTVQVMVPQRIHHDTVLAPPGRCPVRLVRRVQRPVHFLLAVFPLKNARVGDVSADPEPVPPILVEVIDAGL